MSEAREYTREEVREKFLEHVCGMVTYWQENTNCGSMEDRVAGVAFSILVALDGCAYGVPGFVVAPCPDPADKQYCIDEGSNYNPQAPRDVKCDIAGSLHESFHGVLKQVQGK